jgi:cytochrome c biogenesis protein CcdA/glutaredoxin
MIATCTDVVAVPAEPWTRTRCATSRVTRTDCASAAGGAWKHVFVLIIAVAWALAAWFAPRVCRAAPEAAPHAAEQVTIEVYTRAGCGRCAEAKIFLAALSRERPNVHVVERRIDSEPEARRALEEHLRRAKVGAFGVPAFVIRGQVLVGFEDGGTTESRIRNMVNGPRSIATLPSASTPATACGLETETPCDESGTAEIETKLLGRLSVSRLGLPLFTLLLGLLDGFNPCAMWVLLFLLAMLAGQRDRKRMAVTAATFVIVSGVVYYAFMAAWLGVFLVVGVSQAGQVFLGLIALGIGALNIKDFFAFQRGPSLSIPEGAKPGIYARVRAILRAKTLVASVLGVAVLAVLVNAVELLCTAGFPAVYTSVLARMDLGPWTRAAYLGLYNLAYVADDALMVTIAVVTLSRRRLTERAGRWLKLASGIVMLALGLVLLFMPEWLG